MITSYTENNGKQRKRNTETYLIELKNWEACVIETDCISL